METAPGRLLAGRFRLIEQLGSGTMGEVWRAEHLALRAPVAVKLIDPTYVAHPDATMRFLREARAAAALRSAHIVQVFDFGVEGDVPYMVMELLEGESLATRLARSGHLPFVQAAHLISQVARGVGKAHQAGIVHRDLKPDNVFLATDGDDETVKVLDFGVAKLLDSAVDGTSMTRTTSGMVIGTPAYMSPEQAGAGSIDHRSDLWSLAVITFECVTGRRPFQARGIGELLEQICDAPIPAPSSVAVVPQGFDAWFARAAQRDPAARYQSASEMADALRDLTTDRRRPEAEESSRPAPCGAVFFAEIEEPVQLRQRAGKNYYLLLEDVRRILRRAVARADRVEVDDEGQALSATFADAAQALNAAAIAQSDMLTYDWPIGAQVRVRIALGAELSTHDRSSQHVERLAAAAHGGQILVSGPLAAAIAAHLPSRAVLLDLAEHQLTDDGAPEHVFQLSAPGLTRDFPPLRSANASQHNLPAEHSAFVGRHTELRRLRSLLADSRLITLTGPGGTGKTRLALRVAAEQVREGANDVYFVPLAEVRDAMQVAPTLAATLRIPESNNQSSIDAVIEHLAERRVLLVLDNLEQVAAAAPDVARLLEGAPNLRVLVTSRVPLGLQHERLFPVPPLDTPAGDGAFDLEQLAAVDGVELFVQRARAAEASFVLSATNASAVARIVARVDGLPLAIELAAARIQVFSPDVLAERLEHDFDVLRGSSRELPARHRTLRDTVAWSYDLLDDAERAALRRLSVFIGGFTIESMTGVIGMTLGREPLDLLGRLVDKSLVRRQVTRLGPRFSMLEPIREFAETELDRSGEGPAVRRHHVEHFLTVAEGSEAALHGSAQIAVQDSLTADAANLTAALRFCLETGDADSGLRIGSAIWRFWQSTGRLDEGRRWLTDLLALPQASPRAKARGLGALAGLDYWQARYASALERYRAALEIFEHIGDAFGVADTLFSMSTASSWHGDTGEGSRLAEDALARFEALGAREQIGMVRMAQGFARWMQGDLAGARPLWESSIGIAREVGDHAEAAHKGLALASITFQDGRPAQALDEAFDAMEELWEHGNVSLTVMALDWIAALAAEREPERCARLAAAAAELRRTLGGGMRPEACGLTNARDVVVRLLDDSTLDRAWREGTRLPLHQAVQLARSLRKALSAPDE